MPVVKQTLSPLRSNLDSPLTSRPSQLASLVTQLKTLGKKDESHILCSRSSGFTIDSVFS
jgi:hypothetical protein